ncbi:MAG: tartrate dehydrogenase, partial [Oscillibacter sp.]|nr:tartrate dehydrogenase [Oscillibacter sp.]
GLAAGANLNPEREFPSMFEPIHGSAPDIAGRGISNPLAAIWSASQLLDFLGYESWGRCVIDAIEALLVAGESLTPDQGGTATTSECGDALIARLKA